MSNFRYIFMALPLVFALNVNAQSAGVLEEVVVTAQKKEENLQDTPIAITAITESTIDDLNLANVVDLAGMAPNVHIINTPSNNTAATIAMRGGVTINPAITWEPTVGMYLDGVYIGKGQGSIFDVVDLERVEILRGPQGTLYGRNTLGGAINLITKKPSGSGTSSKLTIGNYGLKQGQLIGDYSLGENVFAKLSLNQKVRNGYVGNAASPYQAAQGVVPNSTSSHEELDTIDSKGMKFSLLFDGDDTSINLTIDRTQQKNIPPFAQLTNTIPNWSAAFGVGASALTGGLKLWPIELFASESRQDVAHINTQTLETSVVSGQSFTLTHDLGIGELKAIWSKRKVDWDDVLDLDGGPFPVAETERHTKYSAETLEIQLSGSSDSLEYVIGYYKLKDDAYTANPQSYFGGQSAIAQNYSGTSDANAFFGQVTWSVADKWDLTVGARKTEEDKTGFKEYVGIFGQNGQGSFDDTSSTFILSHDYSENTNLYFKLADGFKAGGINAEAPTPFESLKPYEPETIESTELGLKGRYFDNRMMLNIAYFDNEHEDMQISYFTADAAAASQVLNNSADISGLEVETTTLINDTTRLMVNLSTLDSEFTGNQIASDGFLLEQVPYSPETTLYVSLEKDYGNYRIRLDHSRIGEHATFPYSSKDPRAALTNLDSRGTTDFRLLTEPMENMQLNFWIKNLNNDYHKMSAIPFGPGFGQLTVSYFNAPRTLGMDLQYKF
ncbi:TonB-dependent receptor [Gammaproteobacteria bacterium]|nr:TonB-dependent receptor [Gammaproteobacteria bacterium]